jgi:hypothetical protein
VAEKPILPARAPFLKTPGDRARQNVNSGQRKLTQSSYFGHAFFFGSIRLWMRFHGMLVKSGLISGAITTSSYF